MSAAVSVVPRLWAVASIASAASAVTARSACRTRKAPHALRLVDLTAAPEATPAPAAKLRPELVPTPETQPEAQPAPVPELAFYRKHTEGLLRRYVKLSMEAGRVPSMLGREMFRGNVTSCRVHGFDDVVIFTLDIERCLHTLTPGQQHLVRRIALQEYTQGETAAMLGLTLRTVVRRYAKALDELTAILLERKLLEPMTTQP